MSNADELRSKLPALAGEMYYGIEQAVAQMREALRHVEHHLSTAAGCGLTPQMITRLATHKKTLEDALRVLRTAEEAHDRFRDWAKQVQASEVDHCGLTAAEREQLFGRM